MQSVAFLKNHATIRIEIASKLENIYILELKMELEGKTVVVTGGSTGIGASTVKLLSKKGATVFNLDISTPDYTTNNVSYIQCDVSEFSQMQSAFEEVKFKSSGIDCLFANAGVHLFANLEDTTPEQFDRVVGINLKGVFNALKCVIPVMKAQEGGSIVLMGSDQSFIGKGESSVYGATKGAIAQLAKSTAVDYAAYNIRVNCICPGTIETPLYHNAVGIYSDKTGTAKENIYKFLHNAQPIKRVGQPEEVAEAVIFMLSDKASFMTGSLMSVDGGMVAQ